MEIKREHRDIEAETQVRIILEPFQNRDMNHKEKVFSKHFFS